MSPPPPVSFVLFAYNQEGFVREAVAGVLAQACEPLEIILSDDCSSDRTFEIMQEMAAAYRGPHQVRAVRTPHNLGVIRHVFLRGQEARGGIVVVAAGDDVSRPDRTALLAEAFGDDEAVMAVTSGCDVIDEAGRVISSNNVRPGGLAAATGGGAYLRNLDFEYNTIQGSVASYRRKVFHFAIPPGDTGLWEDNLLNVLIYANGGWVKARTESLVRYRQHGEALINRAQEDLSVQARERRAFSLAEMHVRRMESFLWISRNCSHPEVIDVDKLLLSRRHYRMALAWPRMSLAQRGAALIGSLLGRRRSQFKWQAARLFGRFPDYVPHKWIAARGSR